MVKTIKAGLFVALAIIEIIVLNYQFTKTSSIITAHGNSCGVEVDEFSRDFADSRLEIDFKNNNHRITIYGKNGWSINKVWLDVANDNRYGYWLYATGPLNNFDPNPGQEISKAKVEYSKSCPPTPTRTPTRTSSPTVTSVPTFTPSPTLVPTITPSPTIVLTVVPTATNIPTVTPTQTCEELESCISLTPTTEVAPTQTEFTPTPTSTQTVNQDTPLSAGGQSNDPPVCNNSDPGAPSNLIATALGGGKVMLNWTKAPGEVSNYAVAFGPAIGNYLYGDPNVGIVTSYTVKSLNPGGKYCFYVQAQNGCRGGSPSNVVCTSQNVGGFQILGAKTNNNPLIDGIKNSYGGAVLGVSSELAATAEVVYSTNKLPSGNILDASQSLIIPAIGINQPVYLPQKIGDQFTVGHNEVLRDGNLYFGHNGYGVFSQLFTLKIGDKISTQDNGFTSSYQITEKLLVHKSQVDAINTSSDQIALMTCSVTYPDSRIIIKASLIK